MEKHFCFLRSLQQAPYDLASPAIRDVKLCQGFLASASLRAAEVPDVVLNAAALTAGIILVADLWLVLGRHTSVYWALSASAVSSHRPRPFWQNKHPDIGT